MNYIYDVVLNFQNEYYDFYEWNKTDNIHHMRKIPILKINNKKFTEIKNHIVKFDEKSIKYLNNKNASAEKFKQNNITKMKYTFIICSDQEAMAIKLNKNGIANLKSALLPDEEDDALEITKFQNEINLNYQIIQKNKKNNFKTRFESENENFIQAELDKVYKQKNRQKLNYIYLECFNKNEPNIDIAYNKLKKEINKTNNNFKKIYNIFKITKQK